MHRLATAISLCLITALVGCVAEKDHGTHFGLDEHKKSFFALGSLNSSANDGAPLGKIEDFEWNSQLSLRRDLHELTDSSRLTFA
jgi:hypothetical protein